MNSSEFKQVQRSSIKFLQVQKSFQKFKEVQAGSNKFKIFSLCLLSRLIGIKMIYWNSLVNSLILIISSVSFSTSGLTQKDQTNLRDN